MELLIENSILVEEIQQASVASEIFLLKEVKSNNAEWIRK